jgi:soluble lytic murein transglycosylase
MTTRTSAAGTARPRPRPTAQRRRAEAARRAQRNRRRLFGVIAVLALLGVAAVMVAPQFKHAVNEIQLPLRHEDIIRQQAREKNLDPALIAAVIYTESKFRDRTSPAGAEGLMQILPSTAEFIADRSGGTAFERSDLATPQVNISYGSWLLRYLLDRFDGNERLALAAYNAGETNVAAWLEGDADKALDPDEIPFAETRAYVERVEEARERYREKYARELGL